MSLRYRLKALLRPLGSVGDEITGQSGANFVNAVVTTRNYYTHWDAKSEWAAMRGEALVYATSRLTAGLAHMYGFVRAKRERDQPGLSRSPA